MHSQGWLSGVLTLLIASTWLWLLGTVTTARAVDDPQYDHFKCYTINGHHPPHVVVLADQFGTQQTPIGQAQLLCTPVEKRIVAGTGQEYPYTGDHLTCYRITQQDPPEVVTL